MTANTGQENDPQHEAYISKSELGRRLNKQERTITYWMQRGWLPYYKIGRTVRFKWSEVEASLGQTRRAS